MTEQLQERLAPLLPAHFSFSLPRLVVHLPSLLPLPFFPLSPRPPPLFLANFVRFTISFPIPLVSILLNPLPVLHFSPETPISSPLHPFPILTFRGYPLPLCPPFPPASTLLCPIPQPKLSRSQEASPPYPSHHPLQPRTTRPRLGLYLQPRRSPRPK